MDAAAVRGLYASYGDRDCKRAATLLHPDAVVEMPSTAERLVGREAILSFQRAYPEPWGVLTVERVLVDAEGAVAEIGIIDPAGTRFAMAGFWRLREGLLHEGVEYWIDVGATAPPSSRSSSPDTKAARRAGTGDRGT